MWNMIGVAIGIVWVTMLYVGRKEIDRINFLVRYRRILEKELSMMDTVDSMNKRWAVFKIREITDQLDSYLLYRKFTSYFEDSDE